MSTDTPELIDQLKDQAKELGISIVGNMSAATLQAKIDLKIAELEAGENAAVATPVVAPPSDIADPENPPEPVKKSKAQIEQETREYLKKEYMRLIRCRIHNLNPAKNDLRGEIITVGNKYIGTIRKMIPFGEASENGYHLPKILYDDLKARKFQQIRTRTVKGNIEVDTKWVPEYNIEVLPALTEEELAELALKQAAAQRVGD